MNTLKNAGYGSQSESQRKVSIELPYINPNPGSFIMPKKIEYQGGELINGLTFIREVPRKTQRYRRGLFKCHCGKEFETDINFVRFGNTGSCGCKKGYHKHGLTHTPIWYLYNSMIARCHNPDHNGYSNYGGRGIAVCNEWRNDIQTYMDYIIKLPRALEESYSIDRINNNGNYEPGNVRWADKHTQCANQNVRSNNKTGIKGVFFNKEKKKYLSEITVHKKRNNLGYHDTKLKALEARNNYIIENELWEYPIQKV